MGHVLCIINQKGGVGKTTTAINLASFLSEKSYKTLLIDLDPQANATSGTGLRPDRVSETIYDLLVSDISVDKAIYPTPFDHLHMIPSSQNLAGAEIELVDMVSRETILQKRLKPIIDFYDYIIIDCPPSLGLLTVNGLVASRYAIIPLQCEYFALEGVAALVNTTERLKQAFDLDLEILGIVLTMNDGRTTFNRQVIENARSFFNRLVFDTIIPRNIRLSEAPSHGLPVVLYDPRSKGSIAYRKLAEEVEQRVSQNPVPAW